MGKRRPKKTSVMQTSAAAEASQISSPWLGYGPTCRLLVTPLTPLTVRVTCSARLRSDDDWTTPVKWTTPRVVSTPPRVSEDPLSAARRSFDAGSDSRVVDTFVDRLASQSLATGKHQDQSDQRQYGFNQSTLEIPPQLMSQRIARQRIANKNSNEAGGNGHAILRASSWI